MRQRKPHQRKRALPACLPACQAKACHARTHASEHKEKTEAPRARTHANTHRRARAGAAPLCGTRGHHYTESTQRKSTKYSETFPHRKDRRGVASQIWRMKNLRRATVTQKIQGRGGKDLGICISMQHNVVILQRGS